MGFEVSDRNEKGMVFLRNATDHHSIGLMQVDGTKLPLRGKHLQMSHLAMVVADAETLFKAREFIIRSRGCKLSVRRPQGSRR